MLFKDGKFDIVGEASGGIMEVLIAFQTGKGRTRGKTIFPPPTKISFHEVSLGYLSQEGYFKRLVTDHQLCKILP